MDFLDNLLEMASFFIVPIAFGIISVKEIRRMIALYKLQSVLLALLTVAFAVQFVKETPPTAAILIFFAVLVPGSLALIIEPLLAQATVSGIGPGRRRARNVLHSLAFWRPPAELQAVVEHAHSVWDEHGLSSLRQRVSIVLGLALIGFSYIIDYTIAGQNLQDFIPLALVSIVSLIFLNIARRMLSISATLILTMLIYTGGFFVLNIDAVPHQQSLAVAVSLLLLGIFTMINRQDLISQVIGLLVMDHGLFLAAVRVIYWRSLIPVFVISLMLYILITLVILVVLLPELHELSSTIEVGEQNQLRG